MNELTADQILFVHAGIMAQDGGDARVLSEATLHEMVFRANLVQDARSRAAFVLFSLCAYPAFREGNKRTAKRVVKSVLEEEGYLLADDDPRLTELLQGIVMFRVEQEDIEAYLVQCSGNR
jgi:prophage maintenance system killer protein